MTLLRWKSTSKHGDAQQVLTQPMIGKESDEGVERYHFGWGIAGATLSIALFFIL